MPTHLSIPKPIGFYVYLHIYSDVGGPVVFYVGKGKNWRAWGKNKDRSAFWRRTAAKHGYDVLIHTEGLTNAEANDLEISLIKQIGRRDLGLGTLVNHTDGGDGTLGAIRTPEQRLRIGEVHRGKVVSGETRSKISAAIKARDPQYLANCVLALTSPDSREKSLATRRRLYPNGTAKDGTREKMSANVKAHWVKFKADGRKRKGVSPSAEHRQKLSAARKAYWERIRKTKLEENENQTEGGAEV